MRPLEGGVRMFFKGKILLILFLVSVLLTTDRQIDKLTNKSSQSHELDLDSDSDSYKFIHFDLRLTFATNITYCHNQAELASEKLIPFGDSHLADHDAVNMPNLNTVHWS